MGLGLALGATRRIVWNDVDFRNGKGHWSHRETRGEFSIYGEPAGFIGFGSLGRCLKPLLEPFGFPIQVYDPWMTDPYLESQGVTPVNLETLLSTSRLIFVLATPTESNRAFLDRSQLELIARMGFYPPQLLPRGRFWCPHGSPARGAFLGRHRCLSQGTATDGPPHSSGAERHPIKPPRRSHRSGLQEHRAHDHKRPRGDSPWLATEGNAGCGSSLYWTAG